MKKIITESVSLFKEFQEKFKEKLDIYRNNEKGTIEIENYTYCQKIDKRTPEKIYNLIIKRNLIENIERTYIEKLDNRRQTSWISL
jgi:uncharacterized protein YaaW (UPF0174 family)